MNVTSASNWKDPKEENVVLLESGPGHLDV